MIRRLVNTLIAASLLLACTATTVHADTTYTDSLGRFSFAVPAGFAYDAKGSTDGYVAFSNPDQQATIFVYSFLVTDPSLDGYMARYIANLKKDANIQFISDQPQAVTLDGRPGQQLDYLLTTDKGRRHHRVVFALNGNVLSRVYIATAEAAWDAFAQQATALPNGFHFLTSSYPTVYTDPQKRYSFTLPLGWQHDLSDSKTDGTRDGFIGFNPDGSFYVIPIPVETGVTLDQYVADSLSDYLLGDVTIETSQQTASPIMVAGLPALQWEFFNTADNARYHHRLIWFYSGALRYRLSINTRDDHWDAFLPQATLTLNSLKVAP